MRSLSQAIVGVFPGAVIGFIVSITLIKSSTLQPNVHPVQTATPWTRSLRHRDEVRLSGTAESLFQSVAPLFFPIDPATSKIKFPSTVKTVAIDIGARQSDYLATLEETVDETVALILFDPLPVSFLPLQQRAAKYSLTEASKKNLSDRRRDRVFAIHAAVGEEEGHAQFHVAEGPACGSLLSATKIGEQRQNCARSEQERTVMVFTLKDILDMIPENIESIHLKIDAEGADFSVLKGAGSSIMRAASVVIECQDLDPDDPRVLRAGSCLYREAASYMCETYGFCDHKFEVSGPKNQMGNVFFLQSGKTVDVPSYYQHGKIQFRAFYQNIAKSSV